MASSFDLKTPAVLKESLIRSMTSFLQLYDQHEDGLHRVSQRFSRAAAGEDEGCDDVLAQALLGLFGGALGGICGSVTGGLWGALGAVVATVSITDVNSVGATVGFFGSVLGGVIGAAFSGLVGSAVYVAAKVAGHRVHFLLRALWFGVGFATGGAIGSTFGGLVGAAGGAVGGGIGALHATTIAVDVVGSIVGWFSAGNDSTDEGMQLERANRMQKTGQDFRQRMEPLVKELKTIREISYKMASSDAAKSVAGQTAKTLAAVDEMEKHMSDGRTQACFKEAAQSCRKITDELQKMRADVKELLVSLQQPQ